ALEEDRELAVVHAQGLQTGLLQLRLECARRVLALAQLRPRAGRIEARAAALEAEQRHDRRRPRLGRRVDPGVERVGRRDPPLELLAQLVQPRGGEVPLAGALDALRLAEVPKRRDRD